MLIFMGILAIFTAVSVYLTERIDRPRRRLERETGQLR